MQLNLQHSIKTHLEAETGIPVIWVYDGVKLPAEKPFITIEQMQNNNEIISKLRESIQTTYRFQVGLHANSASERSRKQEEIQQIFLFAEMELLDAATPGKSLGFFNTNLTAEVPMPADDLSDKTSYHRVYFDIEVDMTFNRRRL
ncbi:hypothetical protein J1P26_20150 [Neobacillus sp. MM2021_6]|uniref:hypothetical protein n=1 Tax=Bacillaceae TaxID=186817 RepID=UPI00140C19E7|nr:MULTISPECIES: hypothetical protein [Bacillaceae]MBO0962021.1 hypothetical protein [Neobacillus sp. MM2021_6]NHC20284.1 hypothetical protein [Bacillus sp. MM2020_4]